jgi:transcription antitermination factor NusG
VVVATGDASPASETQEPSNPRGPSTASWFAVWTRGRHEAAVYQQLVGKGVEAFLPTITRWSHWKDRKKQISWPLFPGYCFARINPIDILRVLNCTGVVSLVSFESRPAPIPDREIEAVRTLVESNLRFDPCPLIQEGDRVEVVCGPLRGVTGRLVRKGAHARLVLSVGLIGQGVMVEVDAGDVRPY